MKILSHALAAIVAIILFQTLFFKFTGAPESVFIFNSLGAEPWGRWLSGVTELLAGLLILVPASRAFGAVLSLGIIIGALLSHIFVLGIVVQDDGGLLFALAAVVFVLSGAIIYLEKVTLLKFYHKMRSQN